MIKTGVHKLSLIYSGYLYKFESNPLTSMIASIELHNSSENSFNVPYKSSDLLSVNETYIFHQSNNL